MRASRIITAILIGFLCFEVILPECALAETAAGFNDAPPKAAAFPDDMEGPGGFPAETAAFLSGAALELMLSESGGAVPTIDAVTLEAVEQFPDGTEERRGRFTDLRTGRTYEYRIRIRPDGSIDFTLYGDDLPFGVANLKLRLRTDGSYRLSWNLIIDHRLCDISSPGSGGRRTVSCTSMGGGHNFTFRFEMSSNGAIVICFETPENGEVCRTMEELERQYPGLSELLRLVFPDEYPVAPPTTPPCPEGQEWHPGKGCVPFDLPAIPPTIDCDDIIEALRPDYCPIPTHE